MRQHDLERVNKSLPTHNVRSVIALFKLQLQLFFRRFSGRAQGVERTNGKRSPRIISPRLAVVVTAAVLLFASFPLRMEVLSIISALAIWFAMQETDEERKARQAEEVADNHARVYSEELARQMARNEAERQKKEGTAEPQHGARRAKPTSDSVTYH